MDRFDEENWSTVAQMAFYQRIHDLSTDPNSDKNKKVLTGNDVVAVFAGVVVELKQMMAGQKIKKEVSKAPVVHKQKQKTQRLK